MSVGGIQDGFGLGGTGTSGGMSAVTGASGGMAAVTGASGGMAAVAAQVAGPMASLAEGTRTFLADGLASARQAVEERFQSAAGPDATYHLSAELSRIGDHARKVAQDVLPERAVTFLDGAVRAATGAGGAPGSDGMGGARGAGGAPASGSGGVDLVYVANDGGWDTELWSIVAGEPRGPRTLDEYVDAATRDASGQPIRSFEINGHGMDGVQFIGDGKTGELRSPLSAEQRAAFARLGKQMATDGVITLGGCNVARGAEGERLLREVAAASGRRVEAGVEMQLPLGGIEGKKITYAPNGKRTEEQSTAGAVYDEAARLKERLTDRAREKLREITG